MADKDVLSDALEEFKLADEAASENRNLALEDIRFARLAEQWPDDIAKQREREGRPMLTINRLPAFGRRVVNEARQNRPAITIKPASDQADVHTAAVITGLIRNIEQTSDADVARDTGVEAAVFGGFGYWRVDVDYASDDVFDLDICVRRIANPFTVFADPRSTAADASDWRYGFVTELLPLAEFKSKYKGAETQSWEGADDEGWFTEDSVRIAEWWKREEVMRQLVQLNDGSVLSADEFERNRDLFLIAGLQVKGERTAPSFKVTQRLISGAEVLDTKEWAGRYIPIIPCYGDEVNVEGKRYFRSLIRDAKDPQKMLNFWRTAGTELVALAPKVPFIGARGQFTTDAEKWSNANRQSYAYLEYDPIAGMPPPQRQPLDSGVAAGAMQEAINASEDMKTIMGIYDPSLGEKSNETSGIAIRRRQSQTDIATFHFLDNLNRAVKYEGRVILDLIPQVYTGERIIRILGEDGTPQSVPLNQPTQPPQMPGVKVPPGLTKVFDLTVGKYDVVVKAGPSYGTKREEAAEQQIAFMQAVPAMAPLMTDILADNLDWPQADKLKERIEQQMANPPPNPEMVKAQAQGQLEQMKVQAQGQLEQMKAQLQAMTTKEVEQVKGQVEIAKAQALAGVDTEREKQKALIEQAKNAQDNQTKVQIEAAKIASAEKIKAWELEAQRNKTMLELAAGILSAREGVRGQNISNGSTLDQTGAAVADGGVFAVMEDIETSAEAVERVVTGRKPKRKPKKARISKQPDGSMIAQELEDEDE
jgi:hypothetical protein